MQGGDRQQPWIIGGYLHYLDQRASSFGAAMQEVMAGALGAPAPAAEPEKN